MRRKRCRGGEKTPFAIRSLPRIVASGAAGTRRRAVSKEPPICADCINGTNASHIGSFVRPLLVEFTFEGGAHAATKSAYACRRSA
jgi:hypothetical protein